MTFCEERAIPEIVARLIGVDVHVARQPMVQLADATTIGVELLARPQGDFGGPADFFRLAAQHGILRAVDVTCLRACLTEAERVPPEQEVHINIYPSTLLSIPAEDWTSWMPSASLRARVCIELCEQEIIGDPVDLKASVRALRRAGFRIAIDDVGFGRTCLENLVVLEPDVIKIDRRFVHRVSESPGQARQLGRLLRLVKTLGGKTVVEGVEHAADARICADLGADCGQGYLWGRPTVI
jgi:EAL domain-containing protein (putative c-di-GMP-specific phosphodiesterase class I)